LESNQEMKTLKFVDSKIGQENHKKQCYVLARLTFHGIKPSKLDKAI
jgi:hypothetical protein